MPTNLLIIHPAEAQQAPAGDAALLEALRQIEFIADAFSFQGREHWRPGERFLELITFLGCSPVVSLGAPGKTGDEFCHIQFDMAEQVRFVHGENAKPPRCPSCGQRIDDWQQHLTDWEAAPMQAWTCPNCGQARPLQHWRWRQCAGFGRYFIRVWGIFEGEAVPGDELLAALETVSGFPWRYFYLRSR